MKLLIRLSLIFMMLTSAVTSWAQVSFTVDAPALTALGQPFRVEFTVDKEPESGSIEAPSFEGFDILAGPSVSTGHSIQFINGKLYVGITTHIAGATTKNRLSTILQYDLE